MLKRSTRTAWTGADFSPVGSVFYLFFESFPLVFEEMHGFSLGVLGLAYIGFLVTGITAVSRPSHSESISMSTPHDSSY